MVGNYTVNVIVENILRGERALYTMKHKRSAGFLIPVMFYHPSFYHEDNIFTDVGGKVSNPFKIAGDVE